MILPLEKLTNLKVNKFEFTKACMMSVQKIKNIKDYPEEDINWKIVPNILKLVLDDNIKYYKTQLEDSAEETD